MNAIKTFLTGVWIDLRARRLLPVAALLLAGLVAAPLVLSKQVEEPAPAPAPAETQTKAEQPRGPEALAQVKLEDEIAKGSGSSLSAFDESNPFAPPRDVIEAARRATEVDSGVAVPDGGGGTADTGTGTGTGTGGGDGTTTGDGTPDTGGDGESPKTTEFTYVLDVTFWANGRRRKIEGLEKLDMLPNQAAPLLIFMGVSDGAGNAVFLVDSTLATAGEGKCKPSRAECAFLYLGAGSEQEFTNEDGDSYGLRIDEIRQIKVGENSGSTASAEESSKSARAAVGAPAPARRFAFPVLTDLVVQSAEGSDNSTDASERR
ncbi:MAG: hypothetical protein H0T69_07925 [Thermoleophilaceae bacterium]|nr:hypothetical protein [Thermoleophilaceae bacterium]